MGQPSSKFLVKQQKSSFQNQEENSASAEQIVSTQSSATSSTRENKLFAWNFEPREGDAESWVDLVPSEIHAEIFSYLSRADLLLSMRVCRRWRYYIPLHLRYLSLVKPSVSLIAHLLHVFPNVNTLRLLRPDFTETELHQCFSSHPQLCTMLRRFEITGCNGMCNYGPGSAVALLQKLSVLKIEWIPSSVTLSSDSCLYAVCSAPAIAQSLTTLSLEGWSNLRASGVKHLTALTSLTDLSLEGCYMLESSAMACIAQITSLERLNINGAKDIDSAGVSALAPLLQRNLQVLSMNWVDGVTDESLHALACVVISGPSKLKQLSLNCCSHVSANGLGDSISVFSRLQKLSLRSTSANDGTLLQLSRSLLSLTSLDVGVCRHVTDVGLAYIGEFKNLVELNIQGIGAECKAPVIWTMCMSLSKLRYLGLGTPVRKSIAETIPRHLR